MEKIYVPNLSDYSCVVVRDNNTIRAYRTLPTNNSNVDYVDYYYNSHYYQNSGTQNFSQYSTLPTCISSDYLTSEIYYRNDFPMIIIMICFFVLFGFWFPWRLFTKMFRRWG